MAQELPQPDRNRLGVVMALVLLTYALLRVVVLPSLTAEFHLLGLIVRLEFNTRFVMLTLAAALTIAGADWLIRAHPWLKAGERTIEHWVIPGLAALGVGAILARIPEGPAWWLGLLLAAALLAAVLATEFIVVEDEDPRYDGASVGLTALAYLLLVGSLFAIRATGMRAAFAIPLFFLACTAVSWRLLHLQQPHARMWRYASLIGLIIAQLAWGLHYWRISPLREALVLGLGVYLGTGLALAHERQGFDRSTTIELSSVGAIALAAILILS